MWKTILLVPVISLVAASMNATDYVKKRIDCPIDISVRVDAVHHIGSDPTFTEWSGSGGGRAKLNSISRDGQTFSCSYKGVMGIAVGRSAVYRYTVKRKIKTCEQHYYGNNWIDCLLEP